MRNTHKSRSQDPRHVQYVLVIFLRPTRVLDGCRISSARKIPVTLLVAARKKETRAGFHTQEAAPPPIWQLSLYSKVLQNLEADKISQYESGPAIQVEQPHAHLAAWSSKWVGVCEIAGTASGTREASSIFLLYSIRPKQCCTVMVKLSIFAVGHGRVHDLAIAVWVF